MREALDDIESAMAVLPLMPRRLRAHVDGLLLVARAAAITGEVPSDALEGAFSSARSLPSPTGPRDVEGIALSSASSAILSLVHDSLRGFGGARAARARAIARGTTPIRRALLLGDLHAALAAVLARFGGVVDAVVSVGDIMDGDVRRCRVATAVSLLMEAGTLAVRGNHDRWWLSGDFFNHPTDASPKNALDARGLAWLGKLPPSRVILTDAGRALVCHGLENDDMIRFGPRSPVTLLQKHQAWRSLRRDRCSFLINGHMHCPFLRLVESPPGDLGGPITVINAGTLHLASGPSVSLLDTDLGEVLRYPISLGASGEIVLEKQCRDPLPMQYRA